MSTVGLGRWITLGVMVAALGCGSGGGGAGSSTTATGAGAGTTSTATATGTGAGTTSTGTGSANCKFKGAACQSCIPMHCTISNPPQGWQAFQDCICAAQLADDMTAESQCVTNFSVEPGGAGLDNCINNACDCE